MKGKTASVPRNVSLKYPKASVTVIGKAQGYSGFLASRLAERHFDINRSATERGGLGSHLNCVTSEAWSLWLLLKIN